MAARNALDSDRTRVAEPRPAKRRLVSMRVTTWRHRATLAPALATAKRITKCRCPSPLPQCIDDVAHTQDGTERIRDLDLTALNSRQAKLAGCPLPALSAKAAWEVAFSIGSKPMSGSFVLYGQQRVSRSPLVRHSSASQTGHSQIQSGRLRRCRRHRDAALSRSQVDRLAL